MAQPIYNPASSIKETGEKVASSIEGTLTSFANQRLERARQAENKMTEVRAIKDELGKYGGDLVKEEVDALIKDMRSNIYKETKKSGRYTVDVAAIGSYRDKIDELKNLAANTEYLGESYAEVEKFLNKNKGYVINEGAVRNQALRNFTTKEWLSASPAELEASMLEFAASHLNYEKMIYDDLEFGQDTVSYNYFDGSGTSTTTSEVMERKMNPETGKMEFVAKEPEMTLAIDNKIEELGLEGVVNEMTGEPVVNQEARDRIKEAIVNASKNSYTYKEGDPYAEEKAELEMETVRQRNSYYENKNNAGPKDTSKYITRYSEDLVDAILNESENLDELKSVFSSAKNTSLKIIQPADLPVKTAQGIRNGRGGYTIDAGDRDWSDLTLNQTKFIMIGKFIIPVDKSKEELENSVRAALKTALKTNEANTIAQMYYNPNSEKSQNASVSSPKDVTSGTEGEISIEALN